MLSNKHLTIWGYFDRLVVQAAHKPEEAPRLFTVLLLLRVVLKCCWLDATDTRGCLRHLLPLLAVGLFGNIESTDFESISSVACLDVSLIALVENEAAPCCWTAILR